MNRKSVICLLMAMSFSFVGSACKDKSEQSKIQYTVSNANPYMATIDSLVATDALGRSFGEATQSDNNKDVGMFYFIWHGKHTAKGVFDISKLLETDPEKLWDPVGSAESPTSSFHYWTEPLYGYYNSQDPYIIARHMELLTMSGLDYLCFDLTNGHSYVDTVTLLAEEVLRLQEQGWNPPRLMGMTARETSAKCVNELYDALYSNPKYDSVWYTKNGKPVVVMDMVGFEHLKLSEEVYDHFYIRNIQWPYEATTGNPDMPWMDWAYPQKLAYTENYMSVSVAQHTAYAFSQSVHPDVKDAEYNSNRGRGWNYVTNQNEKTGVMSGTNLEGQWKTVFDNYDQVNEVMVTGWNEWIAQKYYNYHNYTGRISFADLCDMEFSRDLEMPKNGYGDNYYLQNMSNIRKFKNGVETYFAAAKGTPTLDGDNAWKNGRTYMDFSGEVMERDYVGTHHSVYYKNTTNRNDVVSTEVINDDEYLYIKVNTLNDIVFDYSKDNNLNILLNVTGLSGARWEGYNFVVNRTAAQVGNGKTTLERVSEEGRYEFNAPEACDSYVNGKTFAVRIPLKNLGLDGKKQFAIDFKVADNMSDPSNIMNYYVDGEAAPIGRLNYRYHSGQ